MACGLGTLSEPSRPSRNPLGTPPGEARGRGGRGAFGRGPRRLRHPTPSRAFSRAFSRAAAPREARVGPLPTVVPSRRRPTLDRSGVRGGDVRRDHGCGLEWSAVPYGRVRRYDTAPFSTVRYGVCRNRADEQLGPTRPPPRPRPSTHPPIHGCSAPPVRPDPRICQPNSCRFRASAHSAAAVRWHATPSRT